jgi:hypothetical protein
VEISPSGRTDLAIGDDPPAFRTAHPISEIFAIPEGRIAAAQGQIAEGEALGAVGGNAGADRNPLHPALAEGRAVAESGDHGFAADQVAATPHRHHDFRIEHRREAGSRIGGLRGGDREGAIGGQQGIDSGLGRGRLRRGRRGQNEEQSREQLNNRIIGTPPSGTVRQGYNLFRPAAFVLRRRPSAAR